MAYMAQDGTKSTNRAPMMRKNRSLERMGQKSEAGGVGTMDPLAQPDGEPDEQDGAQIAQEHGPAHEVHMQHDHEGGQHHVMSMHPDGHQHESMHGSVEEAHEHGKKLAGGGMEHESKMGAQDEGDEPEYE